MFTRFFNSLNSVVDKLIVFLKKSLFFPGESRNRVFSQESLDARIKSGMTEIDIYKTDSK